MYTTPHDTPPPHQAPENGARTSARTEKQQRELWMYLAVSLVAIEFFIFIAALFFAFIAGSNGQPRFPWLSWSAMAIGIPCLVLLAVHLAVGLFSSSHKDDEEWQRHLPERLQKAYTIIKRAPAVVLLLGVIVVGAALFTLDGALHTLESFLVLFKPYILHILIGCALMILILGLGAFWLNYRTRKLYADYEYRRAVLEKTGLVIVDEKTFLLSSDTPHQPALAPASVKALPESSLSQSETAQDASANDTQGDRAEDDITDVSYTETPPHTS